MAGMSNHLMCSVEPECFWWFLYGRKIVMLKKLNVDPVNVSVWKGYKL